MRKIFPYLEVRGTHRDIGHIVGETFRDKIRENVSVRKNTIPEYRDLRYISQKYFIETLHQFPRYIEELTATAIAANVGLMDLFFTNTRSLYDEGIVSEKGELVIHDRCTTVVSFNEKGVIVGHNEDWDIKNINDLYILKATVGGTTFIGLNYVNELPGTSAAMNNWGLVQGINEVHQKEKVGIPKNFLARAVLECKTIGQALALLQQVKLDTGYNHVLIQKDKVANIEIAGGETDIVINKDRAYVHTNHSLSDLKKHETYYTISSERRFSKASKLIKINMSKTEIINILSDHTDETYPICRHDATMASLVFNPNKGQMEVCYGPPCQGNFTTYTL